MSNSQTYQTLLDNARPILDRLSDEQVERLRSDMPALVHEEMSRRMLAKKLPPAEAWAEAQRLARLNKR